MRIQIRVTIYLATPRSSSPRDHESPPLISACASPPFASPSLHRLSLLGLLGPLAFPTWLSASLLWRRSPKCRWRSFGAAVSSAFLEDGKPLGISARK